MFISKLTPQCEAVGLSGFKASPKIVYKRVELALPCPAIATLRKHLGTQKAPHRLTADAHLAGNLSNAHAARVQLAHLAIAPVAP